MEKVSHWGVRVVGSWDWGGAGGMFEGHGMVVSGDEPHI